jgi:dihydrofolate synthase/folylpolyglutamate synthase
MNFAETLEYLFSALPMFTRDGGSAYKPGFDNILALCQHIGNPQTKFPTVHIAGTNGKGSSSHSIASVLQEAGYKVGLYTSPHLKNFTERIRINGQQWSQDEVVSFVDQNKYFINSVKPSFFEITVAMAFHAFAEAEVDIAVIEVGMGGRLDSTNIISPLISLITSISFDHKFFLGDTLPLIAGEKAGIIKQNTPVVISSKQPEIAHVFKAKAKELNAPITFAYLNWNLERLNLGLFSSSYGVKSVRDGSRFIIDYDLPGPYQIDNLPGIIEILYQLNNLGFPISIEQIISGLSKVRELTGLQGRWQVLGENPLVLTDTAHNPAGIQSVFTQIDLLSKEHLYVVFGVMKDKELDEIVNFLPIHNTTYLCCAPAMPRALPPNQLTDYLIATRRNTIAFTTVLEALNQAKELAQPQDVIFIGGSTFVVAEIPNL